MGTRELSKLPPPTDGHAMSHMDSATILWVDGLSATGHATGSGHAVTNVDLVRPLSASTPSQRRWAPRKRSKML
jgi:hypothetical protein